MKLNLVPKHVSKSGQARGMIFLACAIFLLTVVGSVFLMLMKKGELKKAVDRVSAAQPLAANAVATSNLAEPTLAPAAILDRNLKLAEAMSNHNTAYTSLYDDVFSFIPAFFRLSSVSAVPNGELGCTVTLNGYLDTFQQYADMNLALLRIPGAVNVSRAGYTIDEPYVPGLTEADQIGSPIRPGESNLPSDPWERWQEKMRRAGDAPSGYQNVGGFGVEGNKEAMPGFSAVTFTITIIGRDIRTPDPTATIMSIPTGVNANRGNNNNAPRNTPVNNAPAPGRQPR